MHYPTYKETYQYDQQGRQTTATQHLGNNQTRVQHYTYDLLGQRVATTDAAARTTIYRYDALGRLIQTTDPTGQSTSQSWDAHDRLTSLTDASGNTHTFEYDKAGRLIQETRPLGVATTISYDAAGQATQRTDAGGNSRSYTYDAAGRLVAEEHQLKEAQGTQGTQGTPGEQGAQPITDQRISYQYDADGLLTGYEQTDGQGKPISSARYSQDAQGRNTQSTITYGKVDGPGNAGNADTFSFTIGQGFNADGQLQSHRWPDGSEQNYTYSNGQLSHIVLPNQSQISYANYWWQQPQQITSPGASKSLSYDALQRLLTIQIKTQAAQPQLLASRSYQYDAAGNITQIESDLGKTQYGYDQLDRLTKAQPDSHLQGLGLPQELYSYDKVHNRTSSAHQGGVWRYNADNQLTRYPSQAAFSQTPAVDTQVTYSPQGHTEQETNAQWSKHYRYNSAERLIGYAQTQAGQSSPSIQASYRYDPFGRRISKTVTEGGNATTTYFIYSQIGLMGEMDEDGKMVKAYGFNPAMGEKKLWSTNPLWQAEVANASLTNPATSYHYLHTDHLATPILATDKTGAITWKAVSEAFGATSPLAESSITMNLRFPGQYWDAETENQYNYRRNFKPTQGRYEQADPLGLRGGINFYAYARNNPLRLGDPEGGFPIPIQQTQPGKPIGSGCGDEKTDWIVPDAYVGFDFSVPCGKHDDCYGACGNPKATCDFNFLTDMLKECVNFTPDIIAGIIKIRYLEDCIIMSGVYYAAVVILGNSAYCEAQKKDCPDCQPIPGCS